MLNSEIQNLKFFLCGYLLIDLKNIKFEKIKQLSNNFVSYILQQNSNHQLFIMCYENIY